MRDAEDERLQKAEQTLEAFLHRMSEEFRVSVEAERLVRFQPVKFDERLVSLIDEVATERGLRARRMTSGAGHDAQMMARIAPSAMIFVPSTRGISHSPQEHTPDVDLVGGANVSLGVVSRLASAEV